MPLRIMEVESDGLNYLRITEHGSPEAAQESLRSWENLSRLNSFHGLAAERIGERCKHDLQFKADLAELLLQIREADAMHQRLVRQAED